MAFFVIHPSIERLTGREIGAPFPQHPYQSRMDHVSAASFSHDSDFCCSFLDKPHRSTTPSPCANLESDRKPPHTCPSAGQRKASPPPRSPAAHSRPGKGYKRQPQGGEQQDTDGTDTEMRRSSGQIAPKPLPSATLIRQTARPGSSWDGQISSLLSVPHCWLPCFARPSATAGGEEFGFAAR